MFEQRDDGQVMGLTMEDIESYPANHRPYFGLNGSVRYFCPSHGSDQQRSFKLNQYTGHFKCYSCGIWGYVDEINKVSTQRPSKKYLRWKIKQEQDQKPKIKVEEKHLKLKQSLRQADEKHVAIRYLKWRGIEPKTAIQYDLGYAEWGEWPQFNHEGKLCRQWKRGRLVFPHTDPESNVINMYGRAVGANEVPKPARHDHLNLSKGVFHCQGLKQKQVVICEGAFDALCLLQAGYNAVAIFGVRGFNIDWVGSDEIIFAFDNDKAGRDGLQIVADQLSEKGKRVYTLAPQWYEGFKDIAELWQTKKSFKPLETLKYITTGKGNSQS